MYGDSGMSKGNNRAIGPSTAFDALFLGEDGSLQRN